MTCECICGCPNPLTPNPGRQLLLCSPGDMNGCDYLAWRRDPQHGLATPRYEGVAS